MEETLLTLQVTQEHLFLLRQIAAENLTSGMGPSTPAGVAAELLAQVLQAMGDEELDAGDGGDE